MSNEDSKIVEWAASYEKLRQARPNEDDFLTTADGSPIRLEIRLDPGRDIIVFARCNLPSKVLAKLGWYCQSMDDAVTWKHGLKVILVTRARDEVVRRCGLTNQYIPIQMLRVTGRPLSNNSILAEIAQW